ncbi:adenylate kinase [Bradyrhizobium japonicum]|uniref:AAA family ATPase n=1 Tax=Bradyrhizobium TaxID=374 RepID=UPI001BA5A81A|nr:MULTISPECIES: AAA family ATPase [Bradyrhizobium]MBR1068323.1 AAA family ATPase [Bradyrhizobium liaoningense]MCP1782618.1 adenylate kinase [Bradyrhizobium japonicum]MCP1965092.1 adenylate kinase [Bradyrhizobium japonicum]
MPKLIIIFGISGVGKTTACKSFIRRSPAFGYISASQFLGKARNLSVEQLRHSSEAEVCENQRLLAEHLPGEMSKSEKKFLLLDAQNVIDNGVDLVQVPMAVVEKLRPCGIILLEANAVDLYLRRKNDSSYRPSRAPAELESQMRFIRTVTLDYSRALEVPLIIDMVSASFELDESISKILQVTDES